MRAEFRRRFEHRVPLAASSLAIAIEAQQPHRHHRRHASRVAARVVITDATIVAPPRDSLPGRGDRFVPPAVRTIVVAPRTPTQFALALSSAPAAAAALPPARRARVHRTTR
jgi:hypothetical protein